jgi:hypothetical protein
MNVAHLPAVVRVYPPSHDNATVSMAPRADDSQGSCIPSPRQRASLNCRCRLSSRWTRSIP